MNALEQRYFYRYSLRTLTFLFSRLMDNMEVVQSIKREMEEDGGKRDGYMKNFLNHVEMYELNP